MNELAGAALPSQKFGANAAWLRINVILYNLLSAYKRVGLPEEFHTARPKRLRFLLLNTVGKVVRHARETLLRCTKQIARALAGPAANPLLPQTPRLRNLARLRMAPSAAASLSRADTSTGCSRTDLHRSDRAQGSALPRPASGAHRT
jgi:hypothetical protein